MRNIDTTTDIKKTLILHITPSYKPAYIYGGTTASVSKLCETLNAHGCDIQVLTTRANGLTELKLLGNRIRLVDGVCVRYCTRLTKDPTHFSISLLWQLWCVLRCKSPVIVHIHSWWNFPAILSLLISKLLRVPVVLSPRGMLTSYSMLNGQHRIKKRFHQFARRWLLQYPLFHTTSTKERDDILGLMGQANIIVLPNIIRVPQLIGPAPTPIPSRVFKLLFLSRIQHKKGLELLFEALKELDLPWQLTIAGTGCLTYIKQLEAQAERLGIAPSINWIGHVSNKDKYQCLGRHDLLVLPSYNENFGNVVLEALLSGIPVLVSKEVGLSEYIQERGLGWVTALNRNSLAQSLTEAYQKVERRAYIRKVAAAYVRRDFCEKQLIYQYLQLYKKVAQS